MHATTTVCKHDVVVH